MGLERCRVPLFASHADPGGASAWRVGRAGQRFLGTLRVRRLFVKILLATPWECPPGPRSATGTHRPARSSLQQRRHPAWEQSAHVARPNYATHPWKRMKMIRELPHRVFSNLRSRLKVVPAREVPDATQVGKGHNLLRLHEYQHRVIVDIFKTSIAGFFAFSLILLSFSLHTLLDPQAPAWLGYVMGLMSIMLLA